MVIHAHDGEIYMDTQGAADEFGVAPCSISKWKQRGLLKPIPQSPPGKPIYRLVDVARAEKAARDNAARTQSRGGVVDNTSATTIAEIVSSNLTPATYAE